MTALWGVLAAAALLWPDKVLGAIDGVPLDRPAEALLVGMLVPALWWFHPRFLETWTARAVVIALLFWKIVSSAAFTQQGWCVRFEPARPYVWNQTGAPHAWDLRADWRSPDPQCSAIMSRPFTSLAKSPVWFFNLPPPSDSWPSPLDRPPLATIGMTLRGYLYLRQNGTLRIDGLPGGARIAIDGVSTGEETPLGPGVHQVVVDAQLTGNEWRVVPTVNGLDPWAQDGMVTTIKRPSTADVRVGAHAHLVGTILGVALLLAWTVSAIAAVQDRWLLAWTALTSITTAALVLGDHVDAARGAVLLSAASALVPIPTRLHNVRGAFLAVGVPWLTFVAVCALPAVGRIVLYESGNDNWMFQRYAYQIVMQGHWLEGGSPTFWFQPLYRWIAGLLHTIFGDSSSGEWLWDGGCLLVGALFSFRLVRAFAGFRWGLVAAALPLGVFALGTPKYLIGRGLSEISSSGFLYLAAWAALRSRHGPLRWAALAALCATLAFYTRLNNLPMALGVAVLAWTSRRWKPAAAIAVGVGLGVLFFAWRTWYYTGVFSVLYGTQRELLAIWRPETTFADGIRRTIESVLMILTVNDPPRFDLRAVPVLLGALVAVLTVVRVPRLRAVAAAPAIWFLLGIASAFIARGSAYPGRFSIHIIPITCALMLCGAAALVRGRRPALGFHSHAAEV